MADDCAYGDVSLEQARQIIDVEQVFDAYRTARTTYRTRFAGTMSWKRVRDREYLYRKQSGVWKSLGPRSSETDNAHRQFQDGRSDSKDRLARLSERLDEMAPVNRALRIGRLPVIAGRVLRSLEQAGLLGGAFGVVGTNALYAYERLAGVQIASAHLATGDIDLLFDARARLSVLSRQVAAGGFLDLLQKVDRSFEAERGSFRATNRDGYTVDLIQPPPKKRLASAPEPAFGPSGGMKAVEIEGLGWLLNSPKISATVIDQMGYPTDLVAPDPRAFALHKRWLSARADREPLRRLRDGAQATLVEKLVRTRLPHLTFDDPALGAFPRSLREQVGAPAQGARNGEALAPSW